MSEERKITGELCIINGVESSGVWDPGVSTGLEN
jgi:hypothetical protein